MEDFKSVLYTKDALELVTVGVEYCAYLEQETYVERPEFISTIQKLLPLLYLKASMLSRPDAHSEYYPEEFVTEEDYEAVRTRIASVLGQYDSYLDLCNDDVRFSDEVTVKTISEDLADIYQAVRNFVTAYKLGAEESMYEALGQVTENFELYWGKSLTSALKALHHLKYTVHPEDENSEENRYEDNL